MDKFTNPNVASARIQAVASLYSECIGKTVEMFETTFGKPPSYYDGEKRNIIDVASRIFAEAVRESEISEFAEQIVAQGEDGEIVIPLGEELPEDLNIVDSHEEEEENDEDDW